MTVVKVNPASVPAPAGRFTHAVRHGNTLYVSGQAALDSDGKVIGEGDITRQSEVVFDYLAAILKDQGATFDDILNIRTYLTSMSDLQSHGEVRGSYITGTPPSSTLVAVPELFRPGLLVEVDVIAALDG